MKPFFIFVVLISRILCMAEDQSFLLATLRKETNANTRKGFFTLEIKNSSQTNVCFVDVPEGSGECNQFYRVTLKRTNGIALKPECTYAPVLKFKPVHLKPGDVYYRMIQPSSYVERPENASESYELTVTYAITNSFLKDALKREFTNVPNVNIEFNSKPILIMGKDVWWWM